MLSFLISPQTQPHGFQISEFPVATSFANIGAFVPTPAGPLGGEMVVRAARNGGIGSTTIDKPDGTWVGYWHPDAIPQSYSPVGAPNIKDDGQTEDLAPEFKAFLGNFGGVRAPDSTSTGDLSRQSQMAAPSGPISITMTAMQPIKIGKSKTPDEGFVAPETKNILQDEEEVDEIGRDTILLSRSEQSPRVERLGLISCSKRRVQHYRAEHPEGEDSGVILHIGAAWLTDLLGVQVAKDISKWNTKKTELQVPVESTPAPRGLSDANSAIGPSRTTAPTVTACHTLLGKILTCFRFP